jgi:branched-chain amino acid transport system substrate-binding protein
MPKLPIGIVACLLASSVLAADTIKIGIDASMTGDKSKVGEGTKYAAQLWLEDIKQAGGLTVGGKKYQVALVVEDSESKAESAVKAATKLITEDGVLFIVGPQASVEAVPAGEVANNMATPLISPWSTNPNATLNRPYVFRACFLDPFQGPVVAGFVAKQYGYKKAAVLYDVASDYPKGLAENFKAAWEKRNGPGSVVAYESFTSNDKDFSSQLTKIIKSGAEFLFTPQYYAEVPLIVQQARELGFKKPIVGSDSWGSAELTKLCGKDCTGLMFSTHYAAAGAKGKTKEFIDRYNKKYGYVPDDVGALTWDALGLVQTAIQNCGKLTGNVKADRKCVRDGMSRIKLFEGITGRMDFSKGNDPQKCAVIVKIGAKGEFEYFDSVCPDTMAKG